MSMRPEEITDIIKVMIKGYESKLNTTDTGTVTEVGDGIARVYGLNDCMSGELLDFGGGIYGMALNLESDNTGCILLGDDRTVKEGTIVSRTGRLADVPVGEAVTGRVLDGTGRPIDGRGSVDTGRRRPVEAVAPGVITRKSVTVPLQTGIKAIDSMIPIGRGQRELIIGDRQTGKTAIAIDTILNQKGKNIKCIYVAIGQKNSTVAKIVELLSKRGAMEYTTVISASASDPAPLQYIAPYAGAAMGEDFMAQGRDVLIVYDDLSKHAAAYRAMSLLLKRPPGREAFPGDVFYLHSRLLERSARLNEEYGGGSMTALPIIETLAGDISAYIPTNVISITDGQIFLETELFFAGQRPAINAGLSVSRVGGAAQIKAMKKVAGRLKLKLAQYRELKSFSQFGSDLDKDTQDMLNHGLHLTELLKQPQYSPVPVENQVMAIYMVSEGYTDDIPVEQMTELESSFYTFMDTYHSAIGRAIRETGNLDESIEEKLKQAVEEFRKEWDHERQPQ